MKALGKFSQRLRDVWRRHEFLSPSEWVERHIKLPPEGSDRGQRPRFDNRPYLRKPLDDLANPAVEEIVFVGPTRSGKTFIQRMGMAWGVAADPAPMLWFDSTVDKGRGWVRKEFHPLVAYNRSLRQCKPRSRHDYTASLMLFPGAPVTVFGANSDAQASGETAMRAFGNEVDKWREATLTEASILEQVRHRTESYEHERKHMLSSTPTVETGAIWSCYLKGTREKWVVRFDGGDWHELLWENVWWDPQARIGEHEWDLNAVMQTARYRDPKTGELWDDEARLAAVSSGHYEATNPNASPRVRSYHINGLYGPLESNRIGELAVSFLGVRKSGHFLDRIDFWNSRMGLPRVEDASTLTTDRLGALERSYLRGEVPEGFRPDVLIIGSDDQTWGFPWVAIAAKWDGVAYVVDWGVAASDVDLEKIQFDYHRSLKPGSSHVIIDCNFELHRAGIQEAIYLRQKRGWIGAEGFEVMKEPLRLEHANAFMGGTSQKLRRHFPKLRISLYEFKTEVVERLGEEDPALQRLFLPQLPLVASETEVREQVDFYKQLLAERKVPRLRPVVGKPPFEFKASGANHWFDALVYAHSLHYYLSRRRAYSERAPSGKRREIEVRR